MTEKAESSQETVLVTGANGYVASWIVKCLLDQGFQVHATVRDPMNDSKIGHLRALAEHSPTELSLFPADLLDDRGFDEAMAGCALVFHTASPFIARGVEDPVRDLIEPAKLGTRNVLEAANRTGCVKRVVLTSSVGAIYGDAADMAQTEEGCFSERHWNQSSGESHQPYSYSKTVAERLAWEVAEAQVRWDLVVVNPGLVFGPALSTNAVSESVSIMRDFGTGLYRFGAPALEFGVVDVRDVAEGHVRAGLTRTASGRHILVSETLSLMNIGNILRSRFGDRYPFPRFVVPKPIVALTSRFSGISSTFVARNVGYPLKFDNRYAQSNLDMTFRPGTEAVVDHFQQLLDDGLIEQR